MPPTCCRKPSAPAACCSFPARPASAAQPEPRVGGPAGSAGGGWVPGRAGGGVAGARGGRGDFDAQAEQAFSNLRRALQAGGSGLDRVAKVTIFLTSMEYFPKIVALRRKWFSAPYPADTIVEVSALYSPDAMIEIEAIALATEDAQ